MVFGFATSVAQILVALTFIASGLGKLRAPGSVARGVSALGLPAQLGTGPAGKAFPWLEMLLGVLLLLWWGPTAVLPLGAALLLAIAFTALVARAVKSGTSESCSCFGGSAAVMSGRTIARNAGLTVLAVAAIVGRLLTLEHPVRLTTSFVTSLLVIAAALAYVYALAASEHAAPATAPAPSSAGTAVSPAADGSLQPLPAVEEEDYHRRPNPAVMLLSLTKPGEKVLTTQMIAQGPVLVLSVSATCGACTIVRANEQALIDRVPTLRVVYLFGSHTTELPEMWKDSALEAYTDPHDAFTGLSGLAMSPGMVLLGADGLLAAGPEYGFDAIMETVEEIAAVLNEMGTQQQPSEDEPRSSGPSPAPTGEVNT